jgi:hypothetical protein
MELIPAASRYKATVIVSAASQCKEMRLEVGAETLGSSGMAVPYSFRRYSGKPMLG